MTARRLIVVVVWLLGPFLVMVLGGLDEPRPAGADNNPIPFGIDAHDWPLIGAWVVLTGYLAWLFVRHGHGGRGED